MQQSLLNWYLSNQRILPFRENHDPYRIWISEIMLQQTQVSTVIPYYNRFMNQYPTVFDLANATEEDVFKLWEGLGYYSRARNLLKCAKVLVSEYEGVFPRDHKKVLKLPGIGPYTAGAILSIAYNLKHPAVDGNVMRVISRIYNIKDDTTLPKTKKVFEQKVMEIIPDDARHFNQALMELGALICTPKNPKCDGCPVNQFCEANRLNIWSELPVKTKKIKNKKLYYAVGVLLEGDKILMVKNDKGLLSGLWGFPGAEGSNEKEAKDNMGSVFASDYDLMINDLDELGKEKHIFTHKTWHMTAYSVKGNKALEYNRIKEESSLYGTELVWVSKEDIDNYPISTAVKKLLKYIQAL